MTIMQDVERIWHLMAKKLANEATPEELEELQLLLLKHPETSFTLQILADTWKQKPEQDNQATENAYVKHLQRMALHRPEPEPEVQPTPQRETRRAWGTKSKRAEALSSFLSGNGMFTSYFKIAWRNLSRKKGFSLINISGLAIGIASAVIILIWMQHEASYDQFHTKKDHVYQLYNRAVFDGKIECWGGTPMVMGPVIKQDYPQAEEVVRTNWVGAFVFSAGDKHLETHGYVTDPEFFKVFSFPLIKGDPNTALNNVHSVVLTEKLANKLFGTTDVVGKIIKVDSIAQFTVTGVAKDIPGNTRFRFEYIIPWNYMKEVGWETTNWSHINVQTYVLLKPGVTETHANKLFRDIVKNHAPGIKNEIFVHPMSKWALWSRFENGKIVGGGIDDVRLFIFVAVFILLIACINYMNLSTARSVKRAREVGIRKVSGAHRGSLVWQFMGESIFIAFIAGILALVIIQPGLGWLNRLIERQLFIPWNNPYFWLSAVAFLLVTGIIAGSYPAFYLSGFKPVKVLKGTFKGVHALVTPRKILVVLQFSFSIIFIICTIIIYRQIDYAQNRDVGFDKNNLAFVYNKGDIQKNYSLIRNELMGSGAVTAVTRTGCPVTDIWTMEDNYSWEKKDPNTKHIFVRYYSEKDLVETLGLKLVAGRDIDATRYSTDSTALLINESAAKLMGFEDPVGQFVKNPEGNWHIVGVVKNFIPGTPYSPVYPMVIQGPASYNWFGTLTFRLNDKNANSDNIKKITSIFKKYNPNYPFDYYFVEVSYANKFTGEKQFGKLAAVLAGLTIFISCLGLFALAAYMAENRTKEIGVRKVLGASVSAITTLLSKDFLQLVIIAFVIASPVAWWAMHHWLQDFDYRVAISWWIFAITGLVSVLIALATVGYQAIKAALMNPVKSLRSE